MFLQHPSCPLPLLLLLLRLLSHPWLHMQPSYLVVHPGKRPAQLCLPATGTQIVAACSWMGEWCRWGGWRIAVTRMTMAFSGFTYPPTSPFQPIFF